jgi:hypothetical protein
MNNISIIIFDDPYTYEFYMSVEKPKEDIILEFSDNLKEAVKNKEWGFNFYNRNVIVDEYYNPHGKKPETKFKPIRVLNYLEFIKYINYENENR